VFLNEELSSNRKASSKRPKRSSWSCGCPAQGQASSQFESSGSGRESGDRRPGTPRWSSSPVADPERWRCWRGCWRTSAARPGRRLFFVELFVDPRASKYAARLRGARRWRTDLGNTKRGYRQFAAQVGSGRVPDEVHVIARRHGRACDAGLADAGTMGKVVTDRDAKFVDCGVGKRKHPRLLLGNCGPDRRFCLVALFAAAVEAAQRAAIGETQGKANGDARSGPPTGRRRRDAGICLSGGGSDWASADRLVGQVTLQSWPTAAIDSAGRLLFRHFRQIVSRSASFVSGARGAGGMLSRIMRRFRPAGAAEVVGREHS